MAQVKDWPGNSAGGMWDKNFLAFRYSAWPPVGWIIGTPALISFSPKYTPILKTKFTTKRGIFEVMDYMPRFLAHDGEVMCPPEIHRNIHLIEGNPRIIVEFK